MKGKHEEKTNSQKTECIVVRQKKTDQNISCIGDKERTSDFISHD